MTVMTLAAYRVAQDTGLSTSSGDVPAALWAFRRGVQAVDAARFNLTQAIGERDKTIATTEVRWAESDLASLEWVLRAALWDINPTVAIGDIQAFILADRGA